jgi:hypothetical protein
MKTTKIILRLTILIGILYSCQKDDVKKYYYDSGELLSEEKLVNKDKGIYYNKVYSKKGYLESEGYINKDGIGDGYRKEYYSDGKLRWRGFYEKGYKSMPVSVWKNLVKQRSDIEIDGHPKVLKVGKKYKLRTYVEGVDTGSYRVTYSNYERIEKNIEDPEKYPFYIIPKKAGNMNILYLFPNTDGYIIVGDPHLSFNLKVEE